MPVLGAGRPDARRRPSTGESIADGFVQCFRDADSSTERDGYADADPDDLCDAGIVAVWCLGARER
ncbi:MAG TPA: hypothetical protein VFU98_11765 [Microlunatus sp.]|nr:hypothetical protein [Microlunatus sp.]